MFKIRRRSKVQGAVNISMNLLENIYLEVLKVGHVAKRVVCRVDFAYDRECYTTSKVVSSDRLSKRSKYKLCGFREINVGGITCIYEEFYLPQFYCNNSDMFSNSSRTNCSRGPASKLLAWKSNLVD